MGSGGVGGITHITAELFKMMAEVEMVHVPYRGVAPALTDLLGGPVQALFANPAQSIPYTGAGKLRALAITTATRSEALPDIPTVGGMARCSLARQPISASSSPGRPRSGER
ncbi:hypothetical protein JQ615_07615 [Bradyrhizobium jicamae]|uniref:Tripartite tricarboxylate transporter family receptor n=1 Tax=Bradyrhizobium jicamae TaxID=280332 RepID=A0ABS5FEP2_9BRAD|nr:hypothetical protein [Bradyrhizobium jicamae]MBR0931766.1 hypothetical protein [Bradyrhizobium jicamae]